RSTPASVSMNSFMQGYLGLHQIKHNCRRPECRELVSHLCKVVRIEHQHVRDAFSCHLRWSDDAVARAGDVLALLGRVHVDHAADHPTIRIDQVAKSRTLRSRAPDGDAPLYTQLRQQSAPVLGLPRLVAAEFPRHANEPADGRLLVAHCGGSVGLQPEVLPAEDVLYSAHVEAGAAEAYCQRVRRKQGAVLVEKVPDNAAFEDPFDTRRLEEEPGRARCGKRTPYGAQEFSRPRHMLNHVTANDHVGGHRRLGPIKATVEAQSSVATCLRADIGRVEAEP